MEFGIDPLKRAEKVLRSEAEAVAALVDRLGESFMRVIEILKACQGRVVVTGIGKSGLVGRKIAATLASTGTPALFLHPAEGAHGDLGMVVRGDVVLVVSNSGETDEILGLLPAIKRLGIPLVVMTGNTQSALARHGDVVLDVSVAEEAWPMNLTPTASTTAALAMGDALAVALLEERGFTEQDFAMLHPAGRLGRIRELPRVLQGLHRVELLRSGVRVLRVLRRREHIEVYGVRGRQPDRDGPGSGEPDLVRVPVLFQDRIGAAEGRGHDPSYPADADGRTDSTHAATISVGSARVPVNRRAPST